MTTDAWITLAVLVVTFGVLAFDRVPAAHDRSGDGRSAVSRRRR